MIVAVVRGVVRIDAKLAGEMLESTKPLFLHMSPDQIRSFIR